MLSTQSRKCVNVVCSSPHLGISGGFWLFGKYFCFCEVLLSGFHFITLAGQTLNRNGKEVLRVAGRSNCGNGSAVEVFFARKR